MKNLMIGLLAVGLPAVVLAKADFARLSFNNPQEIVDLKAGFCTIGFAVMDYDKDGQKDLVVQCGWDHWPWKGTYFFRNPTPKGVKDVKPVFEAAKRVNLDLNRLREPPILGADGKPIEQFLWGQGEKRPDYWQGRNVESAGRHRVDLDGDGIADWVVRVSERNMDSWQNRYDARGNWKDVQLRSFLFMCRGLGEERYAEPVMIRLENGLPLEVYGGSHSTVIADWDGDGDFDFILLDFMDTITYFENVGTPKKPTFAAGRFVRDTTGARLTFELCMAQAIGADWDGDGGQDLMIVEEDSRVAWCRFAGFCKDGLPVFEPAHYFRQRADEVNCGALVCPWTCDWDGDGDEDILVGNSHGYLAFIENLSGKGVAKPKWAAPRYLTDPSGRRIRTLFGVNDSIQGPCESKWGYATISVADWDGDGLPDVMANDTAGIVLWWKNIGTRTKPRLDYGRRIEVEWVGPQPELKWGWRKPKHQENPKDLLTQWRTTPVMHDWTGDGLMDLMMLDQDGYLALFERARGKGGRLVVKSPRRCFYGEDGKPLLLRCWFNRGVGCGRRKFALCDWNGDGLVDLVTNTGKNAEVMVQVGPHADGWKFRSIGVVADLDLSTHDPQPAACDFDGNGVPDLLFGAMDGFIYHLQR